jgi:hypothetical protein
MPTMAISTAVDLQLGSKHALWMVPYVPTMCECETATRDGILLVPVINIGNLDDRIVTHDNHKHQR